MEQSVILLIDILQATKLFVFRVTAWFVLVVKSSYKLDEVLKIILNKIESLKDSLIVASRSCIINKN